MAPTQPDIRPGATVTIASEGFPLTWTVLALYDAPDADGTLAHLASGQTGRKRHEPVINLTSFDPKGTP
jgi:hypothetical protein